MTTPERSPDHRPSPGRWGLVALAWALVGLPLLWGVFTTVRKALPLFRR